MRVLVIGGTRFFGLEAVRLLVAKDAAVTVVSRCAIPDGLTGQVRGIRGDRGAPAVLERLEQGRGFDAVLDNVAMSGSDVEGLLEALPAFSGHYLLTSTGSVYLDTPSGAGFTEEEARLEAGDPELEQSADSSYALGKRQAERALMARSKAQRFAWTIVRPTIVFGPQDPSGRLCHYVDALLDGRGGGPGEFVFNPIFSADLARLLVKILEEPARDCVYNAAGLEVLSIRELCAKLALVLQVPLPAAGDASQEHRLLPPAGRFVLDIERARRELQFSPTPLYEWLGPTAWSLRRNRP